MPTIAALLLAGVLAHVIGGWIEPYVGTAVAALIGLGLWLAIFYWTRRMLAGLRGD